MEKLKRVLSLAAMILIALLLMMIGTVVMTEHQIAVVSAAQTNTSAGVKLSRTALTLGRGETCQLSAVITGKDTVKKWTSSNTAVVSVTDGQVTALSAGEAVVKVRTAGGNVSACRITVKNAPSDAALNVKELVIGAGEKYQLIPKLPEGTASFSKIYTCSNQNLVSCSASGALKAKHAGTVTVTLRLFNGVSAQCRVTVKNAPSSASLNVSNLVMGLGEKYSFSCRLPDGTAAKSRTYSTDNTSVLSLSGNTIQAKKTGTANVTVKLYNGVTAQCKVTVKDAPSSARLNTSLLTIGVGETYRFTCTVPDGTAARVRTYTTDNPSVLSVMGSTIAAKQAGTANVTVKLYNGVTAQCKVTVKPAPSFVTLYPSDVTIAVGECYYFFCNLQNGTASNMKTYTAGDNRMISFTNNCVTGKTAGTTNFKVTLYNGVSSQSKVTVMNAPKTFSLNYSSLTLDIGETEQLRCVFPSGCTSYHQTFTTSNKNVVSCDSTGHIRALQYGTATVSVRLFNGLTASCKVTVAPPVVTYTNVPYSGLAVLDIGSTYRITSSGTYVSSDKNVASVDAGGLVRAVGTGTADITVKSAGGQYTKVAVIVYGDKSFSSFPNADTTDSIVNQAELHPVRTNCAELDNLVDSILSGIIRNNMTTAQKVRAVYDYLSQNSTYGYGYIPVSLPGSYNYSSGYWIVTSAYPLLKNHVGTCENFSAALTVLFRRIGLEANCVEGLVGMRAGGKDGHYWTDVVIGGEHYVFDAQVENNNLGYDGTVYHYWYGMRPEYNYRSYEYQNLIPVVDFSYS